MGDEAADDDVGPGPHGVAADLVLADGVARNRPRRRIEPHRFFDHHPRVAELWQVRRARRALPERARDLVVEFVLGCEVSRE